MTEVAHEINVQSVCQTDSYAAGLHILTDATPILFLLSVTTRKGRLYQENNATFSLDRHRHFIRAYEKAFVRETGRRCERVFFQRDAYVRRSIALLAHISSRFFPPSLFPIEIEQRFARNA